jgi:hypothetical protein
MNPTLSEWFAINQYAALLYRYAMLFDWEFRNAYPRCPCIDPEKNAWKGAIEEEDTITTGQRVVRVIRSRCSYCNSVLALREAKPDEKPRAEPYLSMRLPRKLPTPGDQTKGPDPT